MLGAYLLGVQARDRLFTRIARSGFAAVGAGSIIRPPIRVWNPDRIHIGANVTIAQGSWLVAVNADATVEVGDGCGFSGETVLSAAERVTIGRKVLFGRNVHVADHSHGYALDGGPVIDQPLVDIAPVKIDDGAWLGQNVVVLPGTTIGAGAVVGANSVVRTDIPPNAVAVGAPARVVGERRPAGAPITA
jgi:acetyltransferase-like isoleucine patch superfamily enzyme